MSHKPKASKRFPLIPGSSPGLADERPETLMHVSPPYNVSLTASQKIFFGSDKSKAETTVKKGPSKAWGLLYSILPI